MKKLKPRQLIRVSLIIFAFVLLAIFGKNIVDLLIRATQVNQEMVQFYQPRLNVAAIKSAAALFGQVKHRRNQAVTIDKLFLALLRWRGRRKFKLITREEVKNLFYMKKLSRGFTLIELLVVIGVIAILAAIVLVAVNPARNFAQARNTQRRNDIYQVLNACHQYAVSNDGTFPVEITTAPQDIGSGEMNLATVQDNNGNDFVPTYMPAIPEDPNTGTPATTLYDLFEEVDGRLTATATAAELGETITITR